MYSPQLDLLYDQSQSQDEVITESNVQGHLCITKPWPGMARTIYGNHQSFMDVYYNPHPGTYVHKHTF